MQQTETIAGSLRALNGGRMSLEIHPVSTATLQCAESSATVNALGRIVSASGSGIALRPDPRGHDAIPAGGSTHAETAAALETLSFGCRLAHEPAMQTRHSVTRIRAFDPLIRSRLQTLDVALVAEEPDAGELVPRASSARDLLAAAPGYSAATVDLACRYASRFGRQSIQLLTGSRPCAVELRATAQLVDTFRERYPELRLEALPVTDVLRRWLSGRASTAVIVAAPEARDVLFETAGALSGAPGLVTATHFSGDSLCAGTSAGLAGAEHDGQPAVQPSALLLSLADMLIWLGREQSANRIVNGWCRTLEYGCHSQDFRLVRPDARCLDADGLADCVIQWMDAEPQSLKVRFVGNARVRCGRRPARHLRVV